jgi:hypothetical protein
MVNTHLVLPGSYIVQYSFIGYESIEVDNNKKVE